MLQSWWSQLDFKKIKIAVWTSVILAVWVGSASALFLAGLDWITQQRQSNPTWTYALPFMGVAIVYVYQYAPASVQKGTKSLVNALQGKEPLISWKMTPWVLLGTWLTHWGGGSAGREGTAVQMGGSLADQLSHRWPTYRPFFLQAGIAAGFSSVFGTPIAGMFFAYELTKDRKPIHLFSVALASWGAHWVCSSFWGIAHTPYPDLSNSPLRWEMSTLAYTALLALVIGGMARLFKLSSVHLHSLTSRISNPYLRILAGSLGLILLFQWPLTTPFQGLGIEWIQESFETPLPWYFGLAKLIFTVWTLSIGFKGGEATPLFFMGAMTGNLFAQILPLDAPLAVGLGFVSLFGAVVASPWTALWMGIELFGFIPVHLLLLMSWGSYWVAGRRGIYEP